MTPELSNRKTTKYSTPKSLQGFPVSIQGVEKKKGSA
jgi:hypothetical protein